MGRFNFDEFPAGLRRNQFTSVNAASGGMRDMD
jgi:hypothetical protein